MIGTDLCVNKCKHSRSYLNYIVPYNFPSIYIGHNWHISLIFSLVGFLFSMAKSVLLCSLKSKRDIILTYSFLQALSSATGLLFSVRRARMSEVNYCFVLGSSTTRTVSTCWERYTEDQQLMYTTPSFLLQQIGNYGLTVSANLHCQAVYRTLFIHIAGKPYQRTTEQTLHQFEISWRCNIKRLYQYLSIATGYGSNPGGTRFSARPDRPWGPPSLL